MEQKLEATPVEAVPEQTPEARSEYDLHIKVPAEMRQKLKDCAELAYKMGDIPKPDLVNLMNLFINRGMAIQKKKWLDRAGYR
jgi:hypothetical protein